MILKYWLGTLLAEADHIQPGTRNLRARLCTLLLLIGASLAMPQALPAQDADHIGREFYLCFPPNYHENPGDNSDTLYIFIQSAQAANGSIRYYDRNANEYTQHFSTPGGNAVYTFRLAAAGFELEGFNKNGILNNPDSQNEIVARQSFHIEADADISVYAVNKAQVSSDGMVVLPVDVAGTHYYIVSYPSDAGIHQGNLALYSTPSQFAVVATEDDTELSIHPSAPLPKHGLDNFRFTLQAGQVYLVQAEMTTGNLHGDLSGSSVYASKPVQVFAGHQRSTVPVEHRDTLDSRDHLLMQLMPVNTWGKKVLLAPFPRPGGVQHDFPDTYRVMAVFNDTEVWENGLSRTVLAAGEFYEANLTEAVEIQAAHPIQVACYKSTSSLRRQSGEVYGDPFALVPAPVEQYLKSYTFYAPERNPNTYNEVFAEQYLLIIAPNTALNSVRLDGLLVGNFQAIGQSGYSYTYRNLSDGVHNLWADEELWAAVMGYGKADSYAYPAGLGAKTTFVECTVDAGADRELCIGNAVQLNANAIGNGKLSYLWKPTEGLNRHDIRNPVAAPGATTTYTLTVRDESGCESTDQLTVRVFELPDLDAGEDIIICPGDEIMLSAELQSGTARSYIWTPTDFLQNPTSRTPIAKPPRNINYLVTATLDNGCQVRDTVRILVQIPPAADAGTDQSMCIGSSVQLSASGGDFYTWFPADGLSNPNIPDPFARPETTTTYYVEVEDRFGCSTLDSMRVIVLPCKPCSSISGEVNSYTRINGVDRASGIITVGSTAELSAGDQVLIMQMTGALIDEGNYADYGNVVDTLQAGIYEFARVDTILSDKRLRVTDPIRNRYSTDTERARVQLIRVPEYDHVTVEGYLRARSWDGFTGGVLAISANCLILEGSIDADGRGFRGGSYVNQPSCVFAENDTNWTSTELCLHSPRGEGIAHYGVEPRIYGRGAPANGGGGANNHNAGGGGGANAGAGGRGGNGIHIAYRERAGGAGGRQLIENAAQASMRLFMGGGGGSGHANNANGSGGAAGGGIVIIRAGRLHNAGNHAITALGHNAADDASHINADGCGGGGGGGTVVLDIGSIYGDLYLDVRGGDGGSVNSPESNDNGPGPGGGGGGGLIAFGNMAELNGYAIHSDERGGRAGELRSASGNTYGAAHGAAGKLVENMRLPGTFNTEVLGLCRGCYPVIHEKSATACGNMKFEVTDANYDIVAINSDPDLLLNTDIDVEGIPAPLVTVTVYLENNRMPGSFRFTAVNSQGKYTSYSGSLFPVAQKPTITYRKDTLISSPAHSYQWYKLLNGNPWAIPGQNKQRFLLVDDGRYWVSISDTNGCTAHSDTFTYPIVHVPEEPASAALLLRPNPAQNNVLVETELDSPGTVRLELRNALGISVYRREQAGRAGRFTAELAIGHLPSGYYFVLLQHNTRQLTHKLIKQ